MNRRVCTSDLSRASPSHFGRFLDTEIGISVPRVVGSVRYEQLTDVARHQVRKSLYLKRGSSF